MTQVFAVELKKKEPEQERQLLLLGPEQFLQGEIHVVQVLLIVFI